MEKDGQTKASFGQGLELAAITTKVIANVVKEGDVSAATVQNVIENPKKLYDLFEEFFIQEMEAESIPKNINRHFEKNGIIYLSPITTRGWKPAGWHNHLRSSHLEEDLAILRHPDFTYYEKGQVIRLAVMSSRFLGNKNTKVINRVANNLGFIAPKPEALLYLQELKYIIFDSPRFRHLVTMHTPFQNREALHSEFGRLSTISYFDHTVWNDNFGLIFEIPN